MQDQRKDQSCPIPHDVTEIILESISDGVFTIDHQWRIISFNRAAEYVTGIPRDQAIGKHCWEIFRSNMCERDCALRRTMKHGRNVTGISHETLSLLMFHDYPGNIRELGIHKSTLFRKIKILGIELPKTPGRAQKKRLGS